MTQVITLERVTPVARYDALWWTHARIEEAADPDGAWTEVETILLSPVEPDPTNPLARNLTSEDASDGELWYRVVFVDANGDESAPTAPVFNGEPDNLYVSRNEFKAYAKTQGETYADERVDVACESVSRAIDAYKQDRYYLTAETRLYSADRFATELAIDSLTTLTSVTVDRDGDGTYSETWVNGTDFYLDPPNAALNGRPYKRLVLRAQAGRSFPRYARNVKVIGSFGWATTPSQVKQAAMFMIQQFLKQFEGASMGIVIAQAGDMVAAARLGRIHPTAAFLLDGLDPQPELRSLQLG
jgi:hypothetical protein